MTVAAQEALDWLEGWLLQYRTVTPIQFWESAPKALELIDAIRAALPVTDGWRDIATAPCDGVPILCLNASTGEIRVGIRKLFFEMSGKYEWFRDDEIVPGHTWSLTPTHWMPLPDLPRPLEGEATCQS